MTVINSPDVRQVFPGLIREFKQAILEAEIYPIQIIAH
jgi:hypothetical protein